MINIVIMACFKQFGEYIDDDLSVRLTVFNITDHC